MKKNGQVKLSLAVYSLFLLIYSWFSYSLTAPNLILSSWPPYWQFQTWMWATFFNDRVLLTQAYILLIFAIFLAYLWVVKALAQHQLKWWQPLLVASPLLLANNGLSYDVFNYIFNAKMVWVYHANPHTQTALDFFFDDWTRFMHNTHTTAPYFYGWTGISLIPYLLGFDKFLAIWINFRMFSFLSFGLLAYMLVKFAPHQRWTIWILFNPLLIIEIIANSHNDLWMMVPAILSMLLVADKKIRPKSLIFSILLLSFSISIKMATAALIPIWLALVLPWPKVLKKIKHFIQDHWAGLSSLALFLPLLTERSKQFLPWYLLWSLVWLPLIKKGWSIWKCGLIMFSLSSLARYLPYLWYGHHQPPVEQQQLLITWLPLGFIAFAWIAKFFFDKLADLSNSATMRS